MKYTNLILIVLSISSITNSQENKKTVTSYFSSCKDKACCETNLNDCKSNLNDSDQICQLGYESCTDLTPSK